MRIELYARFILLTLVFNKRFANCSNFVVQRFDGFNADPTHLHNLKNVVSESITKCIDHCKKLNTDTSLSCNSIAWDDKTSKCELVYVHQASLQNKKLSNSESENVILVPTQSKNTNLEGE